MEQLKFHLLDCVAGQPCSQVMSVEWVGVYPYFFYVLTICHFEYILSPLCFETSLSPGNPWRPWFQPRREGRRGKIWNHNRLKAWKCSMGTLSNCDFTQWVQNSKWFKLQIFWWTVSLFSKVGGAIQWSFVVKLRNLKEPSDWTHICQIMWL